MNDEIEPVVHAVRVTFGSHEFRPRSPARSLTAWEREILDLSLNSDPTLGQVASPQAKSVRVAEECDQCVSVILTMPKDTAQLRSQATFGQPRFGVAGDGMQATDVDGVPITALVHIRDGYLAEIEVIRADGEPIQELPAPTSFRPISPDGPSGTSPN